MGLIEQSANGQNDFSVVLKVSRQVLSSYQNPIKMPYQFCLRRRKTFFELKPRFQLQEPSGIQ